MKKTVIYFEKKKAEKAKTHGCAIKMVQTLKPGSVWSGRSAVINPYCTLPHNVSFV